MAKNPTPWSNNDVKPPANWTPATKQTATWSNNIAKSPAQFTPVAKNTTTWGLELNVSNPWLYDDPTQKYDDTPLRGYDYLIPVTNTINSKLPTGWNPVV